MASRSVICHSGIDLISSICSIDLTSWSCRCSISVFARNLVVVREVRSEQVSLSLLPPHTIMTDRSFDEILQDQEHDAERSKISSPYSFSIHPASSKKHISLHLWLADPASTALHLVIATHGAGGTAQSSACLHFCTGLASASSSDAPLAVLAFDGSMNLKARTKAFLEVITYLSVSGKVATISLAGRSMGCRAAAMAYEQSGSNKLSGKLVLASYPLIGKGEDVRLQVLSDLPETARILFVAGSTDEMCPKHRLNQVIQEDIRASSTVLYVADADHGMSIPASVAGRGKKEEVTEQIGTRAGQLAGEWLSAAQSHLGQQGSLAWEDDALTWSGWTTHAPTTAKSRLDSTVASKDAVEATEAEQPANKRRRKR